MLVLAAIGGLGLAFPPLLISLDPARDLLGYERKDDLMSTSATCNIRVDLALALADVMRAAGAATRPATSDARSATNLSGRTADLCHTSRHLERNPGCPLSG